MNAPARIGDFLAGHRAGKRKFEGRMRAAVLGEEMIGVAVMLGLDIEAGDTVDRRRGLVDEVMPPAASVTITPSASWPRIAAFWSA